MLQAHEVEGDFFDTLGVAPLLGRTFRTDDFDGGEARVTVLSYSLWQNRFGGDQSVVGRTVLLSLLFGVGERDPLTLSLVTGVLLAVALIASAGSFQAFICRSASSRASTK